MKATTPLLFSPLAIFIVKTSRDRYKSFYERMEIKMLAITRKIKLYKLRKLVDKRNEEFFKGNYEKAIYYGKMVDDKLVNFIKQEEV